MGNGGVMRVVLLLLLSSFLAFALSSRTGDEKIDHRVLRYLTELPHETTHEPKFWIYFTDKGLALYPTHEREQLEEEFSQIYHASLSRRFGQGPPQWDEADYPVHPRYIQRVLALHPDLRLAKKSRWNNAISLYIPSAQRHALLRQIAELECVRKIDLVARQFRRGGEQHKVEKSARRIEEEPNAKYGDSWQQLAMIDVPALHTQGWTGHGVTILILDSGFNLNHPSLRNMEIVDQYDFVNDDDNVSDQIFDTIENADPEEHGTATLSTVGGWDEGKHYGPAYSSRYILAKTESLLMEDPVEEDYFITALEWGETKGAQIVTASLGYQAWYTYEDKTGTAAIDQTIDFAVEKRGITVFVAVGNEQRENLGPGVPGDSLRALSIGAVTFNGDVAAFSSQGPTFDGRIKPDLAAPGSHVQVANYRFQSTGDDYVLRSGTSFACPLAAGVGALLLQAHPEWRPIDIHRALMTTALQADAPDNLVGFGLLNGTAAMAYQIPDEPPHDHGVCDNYDVCNCSPDYYGPYCAIERLQCEVFCHGGYCDDDECHCDTRWDGKTCVGTCEARDGDCIDCLSHGCGYCQQENACMTREYASDCDGGYTESYCESVVRANGAEENADAYFVVSIIVLCFSLLLVASAVVFFFCVIRP